MVAQYRAASASVIRQLPAGSIRRVATTTAIVFLGGISCGGGEVPTGPITPVTPVVTAPAITPASSNMYLGGSVVFTATARDAAGAVVNGQTVIFAVTDTSIASVSGSSVSGRKVGSTTLTASLTSGGRSVQGTAQIAVIAVPVSTVVISPSGTSPARTTLCCSEALS